MSNEVVARFSHQIQVDNTTTVFLDSVVGTPTGRGASSYQIKLPAESGGVYYVAIINWKLINNEGASVDLTLEQSHDDQSTWEDTAFSGTFPEGIDETVLNEMSGQMVLESTDAARLTTTGDVTVSFTGTIEKITDPDDLNLLGTA